MNINLLKNAANTVRVWTITLLCGLLALPIAAWADDDDKPVPIDPQTAAMQNRIIGVIVMLVCLAVAWYYLRRWQISRSGNQVHGSDHNQD